MAGRTDTPVGPERHIQAALRHVLEAIQQSRRDVPEGVDAPSYGTGLDHAAEIVDAAVCDLGFHRYVVQEQTLVPAEAQRLLMDLDAAVAPSPPRAGSKPRHTRRP